MARDVELLEAQVLHHLDLVLGHAPERVVAVVGLAARLAAVAVAPQIGTHHGEVLRQPGRDQMPRHVRERVAVQQQHGRAVAAVAQVDHALRIAGLNLDVLESLEHGSLSPAIRGRERPSSRRYELALQHAANGRCDPGLIG